MRALLLVFGSFGLVLGLLCAVVVPRVSFGWFAYAPLAGTGGWAPLLSFDWFPDLAILPGVGLVLGLLVAVTLHLTRWQLHRN